MKHFCVCRQHMRLWPTPANAQLMTGNALSLAAASPRCTLVPRDRVRGVAMAGPAIRAGATAGPPRPPPTAESVPAADGS